MTDTAPGTAEAVRLLLAALQESVKRAHDLRRRLRAEELNRRRLTAALDPAISTLPAGEADAWRKRLHGAVYAPALIGARAARTRLQAVMEFLAAHGGRVVKVAEVTSHLERQGFRDMPPGYASDTLKRFEAQGLVSKVRFGRYRVSDRHPEIMHHQLDAFEAELGKRTPPDTRARDESPRFAPLPTPEDIAAEEEEADAAVEAEIAANREKIERMMAQVRRR